MTTLSRVNELKKNIDKVRSKKEDEPIVISGKTLVIENLKAELSAYKSFAQELLSELENMNGWEGGDYVAWKFDKIKELREIAGKEERT